MVILPMVFVFATYLPGLVNRSNRSSKPPILRFAIATKVLLDLVNLEMIRIYSDLYNCNDAKSIALYDDLQ